MVINHIWFAEQALAAGFDRILDANSQCDFRGGADEACKARKQLRAL